MDQKEEQTAAPKDAETEARRDFLKKLGKASATAPAVALLLAGSLKSERAEGATSGASGSGSS